MSTPQQWSDSAVTHPQGYISVTQPSSAGLLLTLDTFDSRATAGCSEPTISSKAGLKAAKQTDRGTTKTTSPTTQTHQDIARNFKGVEEGQVNGFKRKFFLRNKTHQP